MYNAGSTGFLNKEKTGTLRGVATVMVVFSHICQYEADFSQIVIGGRIMFRLMFAWGAVGVAIFFFLSGYGCYMSLKRDVSPPWTEVAAWFSRRALLLLTHFVISFLMVILLRLILLHHQLDWRQMISEFLLLRIPGTSTWYFKIQLLFYFVIAVAAKVDQKHMPVIVAVLAFAYAILGKYFGLPDYWWKTAMCFPAGCIVADSRERISRWALQTWALGAAVLFVAVGYVYILKDSRYVLLPQLLAFSAIAAGIALIWNRLAGDNKILRSIGKYSLACYLLHIGIVDYFFVADTNINVKMVSFAITVGIGTWICNTISEKIYLMMRKSRKCV